MELVDRVAAELDLTHRQAEGAVGAVLWLAQHRIAREQLVRLADCIPGFSDLTAKSPRFDATRLTWKDRIGRLLGGSGGVGLLHEPLSRLDVGAAVLPNLISTVIDEVRRRGGADVEASLRRALS